MKKRPGLVVPAVVLGVLLLALAALYFIDSADSLPSFIPGHEDGSSHHHFKHGLAAAILGIGCFVFAWFQTGPSGRPAGSGGTPDSGAGGA